MAATNCTIMVDCGRKCSVVKTGLSTRGLFLHCRYVHDDSETSEDQVELLVTDGVNAAEASLKIQVDSRDILYLVSICLVSIHLTNYLVFIYLLSIYLSIILICGKIDRC